MTRPVMIIWAIRMYQIQEKPRGAVLSVIPEKIPMVVKEDSCNILTRWCSLCIAGRIDQAADQQDVGGIRSGRHTNIRTSLLGSPLHEMRLGVPGR